jgi:arginase
VAIIFLPYHLDEYVPDLRVPLPAEHELTAVVEELPEGDVWTRLAALYSPTADVVAAHVREGELPIVISGDCTASLATVAGLQRAGVDAAVVWFDAHGDVQTLETTASGYVGGMPLRMITGYRPDLLTDRLGARPVAEDRVVLVDARDLDPPEAQYLATAPIRRTDVAGLGADMLPDGPLLLHLDVDVVDAGQMPGLRYPVAGGPDIDEVLAACHRVLDTGRVAAIDVGCTWHPDTPDPERHRAWLIDELLG